MTRQNPLAPPKDEIERRSPFEHADPAVAVPWPLDDDPTPEPSELDELDVPLPLFLHRALACAGLIQEGP